MYRFVTRLMANVQTISTALIFARSSDASDAYARARVPERLYYPSALPGELRGRLERLILAV
jgi:hypothetical protein